MAVTYFHFLQSGKGSCMCAVFGIRGHEDASALVALGLHALQHRGQEAAGIVSDDGSALFHQFRALGLVGDNFGADRRALTRVPGRAAIGHNRYSTTGESSFRNIQPLYAELACGEFAIGHNGNLTNARQLRSELVSRGAIFQSATDTEVIIHLMALSNESTVLDRLIYALSRIEGSYALVMLTRGTMYAARDPSGNRPLVLGELDGAQLVASESCAFDIMGARFLRDVDPGEIVTMSDEGAFSHHPFPVVPKRFCIFEYVYFARPDSDVEGISTYLARKRIGAELAREMPPPHDKCVVVPVPDSGVPAAIGYAQALGLPFDLGLIRNHYVGRTFIEPDDVARHFGVKLKQNANKGCVRGRHVVLIDDSIVRGTTATKIVAMLRAAGARSVHMRVANPPTTHSCYYGVDTPERDQLLAAANSVAEMQQIIGVDSLGFVSLDGLHRAVSGEKRADADPPFCDACLTGTYPLPLVDRDAGFRKK